MYRENLQSNAGSLRHFVLACALFVLPGCGDEGARSTQVSQQRVHLELWMHYGEEAERRVLRDQIRRFNETQDNIDVTLRILPESSYDQQLQAAVQANELPDIVEFDGPNIYRYVWQNQLIPIDKLLPGWISEDLLKSVLDQGTFDGRLYSVAAYDSGLGLWASRARLQQAGVRIPDSPDTAWSVNEFREILHKLASDDDDGAVLDLKLNYRSEWFTYGIAPFIRSAGGDLIDQKSNRSSDGVLNSAASVSVLTDIQAWIRNGQIDPNVDDNAFVSGRVALSWAGLREYQRYYKKYGDDLLLLPLPDFGQGSRTGQGSWNWGITRHSQHPQAAMQLLTFLLRPEEIVAMTSVNGAIPATYRAMEKTPDYRKGGALRRYIEQREKITGALPKTPAYAVISSAFQQAFDEIRGGHDVRLALDKAVSAIDTDVAANGNVNPVRGP